MKLKDIKIQKTLKKTILLNPGPSTTTATVKKSLLQDDICHREGSFAAITRKVADDLVKIVHGKKGDYVATLFAGSGSICIDVAVGSLIPDGKKIMTSDELLNIDWLPHGIPTPDVHGERAGMCVRMMEEVIIRWGRETNCDKNKAAPYISRILRIVKAAEDNRLP